MKSKKEGKYFEIRWMPPGWNAAEWQIVWRKLWLLSRTDLRRLTQQLGTAFVDREFHQRGATKSDLILLIDDGVNKEELLPALDALLRAKGYRPPAHVSTQKQLRYLDQLLAERGLR